MSMAPGRPKACSPSPRSMARSARAPTAGTLPGRPKACSLPPGGVARSARVQP